MHTQIDAQSVLQQEGCPWADFEGMELFLALNNTFASMGFAFGHGEFDREQVETMFMNAAQSPLADEIQRSGLIKPDFEVRVTRGLHNLVASAIGANPASSWSGYGWDVAYMSTSRNGWEFAVGEKLYGCCITDTLSDDAEVHWLVSGLMDPGMWCQKEGWVTFGLAEELLGSPETIDTLTYDSVSEKAFGKEEG